MSSYTLEITMKNQPALTHVVEGLTINQATCRKELLERAGWKVEIITPAMRLREWVHHIMR